MDTSDCAVCTKGGHDDDTTFGWMGTEGGLGGGPPSSPSSSLKLRSWATDSNLPGSDVDDAASLWSNGALNNKMLLRHFFFCYLRLCVLCHRERERGWTSACEQRTVSFQSVATLYRFEIFFFFCNDLQLPGARRLSTGTGSMSLRYQGQFVSNSIQKFSLLCERIRFHFFFRCHQFERSKKTITIR